MDELISRAIEASISNPDDLYEVDIIADVASVGITDALTSTDRKVDWTEEVLERTIGTLKDMPINLRISTNEDGEHRVENHTTTVIGRVSEAYYDRNRKRAVAKGKLWKHYFPETISELNKMHADKKAEVSIEFMPSKMEDIGDDTDRPLDGRFYGLGIVDKGADHGNFIHLLASAKKEETIMKLDQERKHGIPAVGSFEWIGEQVVTHLNQSTSISNYSEKDIVATYPDHTVWYSGDTYYQIPYTIDRTSIKFGDTIEVEHDFKPLSAAVEKSLEPTLIVPTKEADKPMAEINDSELQALQASAKRSEDLDKELVALKAAAKETEDALKAATDELAAAKDREEVSRLDALAASRMEEVEKIQKYDDADQKKDDLETFKTLDDKAFSMFKRALTASAAPKGGVEPGAKITNPNEADSKQDPDGAAAEILASDNFKALVASYSGKKETA